MIKNYYNPFLLPWKTKIRELNRTKEFEETALRAKRSSILLFNHACGHRCRFKFHLGREMKISNVSRWMHRITIQLVRMLLATAMSILIWIWHIPLWWKHYHMERVFRVLAANWSCSMAQSYCSTFLFELSNFQWYIVHKISL